MDSLALHEGNSSSERAHFVGVLPLKNSFEGAILSLDLKSLRKLFECLIKSLTLRSGVGRSNNTWQLSQRTRTFPAPKCLVKPDVTCTIQSVSLRPALPTEQVNQNFEFMQRESKRTWVSSFFGNLALASVILGGWLKGKGLAGTLAMIGILGVVMLSLALLSALIPRDLREQSFSEITGAIGVLLFVASLAIVILA